MRQIISKLRLLILNVLIVLILLKPLPAFAVSVNDIPSPHYFHRGWVTDMANVLNHDTEQQLNRLITKFRDETKVEIAIVTVPETQPYASPKAFTSALFRRWDLGGHYLNNNGLLFMISVEDRHVEIEAGSGFKHLLSANAIQDLLDTEIIPKVCKGEFNGATLAGTEAIIAKLYDQVSTFYSTKANSAITSDNQIAAASSAQDNSATTQTSHLLEQMLLTSGIAIAFTKTCIVLYEKYLNYRERQSADQKPKKEVSLVLYEKYLNHRESQPADQKLKKKVSPAGVIERGWSLLLDLILLSSVYLLVAFLTVGSYTAPLIPANSMIPMPVTVTFFFGNLEGVFDVGSLIGWSGFGAALIIYRTIAEAGLRCTFGQLVSGVRVIKADNSVLGVTPKRLREMARKEEAPISYYAAFVRSLMLSIDGLFLYLVGVWSICRSDKLQRLGDRLARTVVVRRYVNLPYQGDGISAPSRRSGGAFGGSSGGGFGGGFGGGGGC